MKLKRYNNYEKINEGARVNTKILELNGIRNIDDVIKSLEDILEEIIIPDNEKGMARLGIFKIRVDRNLRYEVEQLLIDIEGWRDNNVTQVQGFGTEWIPLWN